MMQKLKYLILTICLIYVAIVAYMFTIITADLVGIFVLISLFLLLVMLFVGGIYFYILNTNNDKSKQTKSNDIPPKIDQTPKVDDKKSPIDNKQNRPPKIHTGVIISKDEYNKMKTHSECMEMITRIYQDMEKIQ